MKIRVTWLNGDTSVVNPEYYNLDHSFKHNGLLKAELIDSLQRIFHDGPVPIQFRFGQEPINVTQDQFKAMVRTFDSAEMAAKFIYGIVLITDVAALEIAREILE